MSGRRGQGPLPTQQIFRKLVSQERSRFEGKAYRITHKDSMSNKFSAWPNRWNDGTLEVLYTSFSIQCSWAEMRYHLCKGKPGFPTSLDHKLCLLEIIIDGVLDLTDWNLLESLGVNKSDFGRSDYDDLEEKEYPASQRVAVAVANLAKEADNPISALIVPSARSRGKNLILLGREVGASAIRSTQCEKITDWSRPPHEFEPSNPKVFVPA